MATYSFATSVRVASKSAGRGQVLAWLLSGNVDFSRTELDVYVSSGYAAGSCEYEVTLDHERTHLAIHRRLFAQYRERMARALDRDSTLPTEGNPLRAASAESALAVVSARLDGVIRPVYDAFNAELDRENGTLDTPERYRADDAKCAGKRGAELSPGAAPSPGRSSSRAAPE